MKAELERELLRYLIHKGEVELPALGRFSLVFRDAYRDFTNKLMHPPAREVQFKFTDNSSEHFARHFSQVQDLSFSEAISLVREWVSHLKLEANGGQSTIPGIGSFSTVESQLVFKPSGENYSREHFGLQPVPLPVFDAPPSRDTAATVATTSRKSTIDQWLWAVTFAVLCLFVYYIILAVQSERPGNAQSLSVFVDTQQLNQTPETKEIEEVTSEDPDDSNSTEEMVDDSAEIQLEYSDPPIDQIVPDMKARGIERCTIITGVFSRKEYVDRMVADLEARGYNSITASSGILTRVGVELPCEVNELNEILRDLRNEFDKDSWILSFK